MNDHLSERHVLEYSLTSDPRVAHLLFLLDCEKLLENKKAFVQGIWTGSFFTLIGCILVIWLMSW